MPRPEYNYDYIATNTTTQVYEGKCVLRGIVVGETAAGAITIYNETGNGTTDVVAVLKASIAEGFYEFDASLSVGLKVVTAAASKITVLYTTY